MPDLKVEVENMVVDKEHAKEYLMVLKSCLDKDKAESINSEPDYVPLLYFEAMATQVIFEVVTHPKFPFFPVGGVHVRSSVQQKKELKMPAKVREVISVGERRAHPRGTEVDFITTVFQGQEEVWNSTTTWLFFHKQTEACEKNTKRE